MITKYTERLKDVEGLILPTINNDHAMHLYVIRLKLKLWGISRNEFIEKMNEGIGLAVHYKPIHQLSYYKKMYNLKGSDFPIANGLFNSIVSLPLYPLFAARY